MSRIVHLNGAFLPEQEAKVSIFDRGYYFGDGVYEVTAVVDGKLVDYAPHMERLDRSLRELSMPWPCTKDELRAVHEELAKRNGITEGLIYMQVTRGVAERDFAFPKNIPSTLMAFTQVKALVDSPNAKTGVKVVSIPDIRWKRRDIKSIALLAQCMGKQQASEAGAFEGWMVEDGFVTEGTSSSSYIVKEGRVITRPLSNAILPGITRKSLMKLAADHDVTIEERLFSVDEAIAADEAFLTSASSFVMPVVEIDGHPIGSAKPGPITTRLRQIYLESARA
ncbi:D-alanine transaminase [Rhodoligotrophos appendicifer]|uniref:D-amino-acid transaminase n=1 Tax=Rhodoligotrophos appendicifer TaxID=987056 RepID=UPI0011849E87|nr:D-amino-acid transaminase [Rhodoligotrophos appendicifer]